VGWLAGALVRRARAPWRSAETALRWAGLGFAWLLLAVASVRATAMQRAHPKVAASPYYDTVGRVVGVVAPARWTLAAHDIGAIGSYGKTRLPHPHWPADTPR